MELELKHLAPYLPYGLRVHCDRAFDTYEMHPVGGTKYIGILELLRSSLYAPILRPLDEFMSLQDGTMFFTPYTLETVDMDGGIKVNINSIPYQDFIWLVANHFDVFGLIDSGLAIDKNTLSPNVAGNP